MKHDYKAAYEYISFNNLHSGSCSECGIHHAAIEHALLMMSKLQEPSEGMRDAGTKEWFRSALTNGQGDVFKAMIEQAEREIEGA